jgi:Zn finger protein HypA/HybF involved in hydrogenase expression
MIALTKDTTDYYVKEALDALRISLFGRCQQCHESYVIRESDWKLCQECSSKAGLVW